MERRYRVYIKTNNPKRSEFFEIVLRIKGIGFLWEPVLRANISKVVIEDLQTGVITQGDPKV